MEFRLPSPESQCGATGWAILAGFVVAWDVLIPDSLTATFARGCEHPMGRFAVPTLWFVTTAHLFGKLPRRADPFYMLLALARKV